MTDDETALRALLLKGTDAGVLREMIGFAAERLMELEVGGRTGAAHGERNPDRLAQRNGYRSSSASRSSDAVLTSRLSWSRAGWPKRRSRR